MDTNTVLLVLLVGLALALLFASRSKTKKGGWSARVKKAIRGVRATADSAVHAESHLERMAGSFAGVNGVVTRSVEWGEFQTMVVNSDDGPVWFPVGNVSHVTGHKRSPSDLDDDGSPTPTYGIIHLKNGSFYNMPIDFDTTRQLVVQNRMEAFKRFTDSGRSQGEQESD